MLARPPLFLTTAVLAILLPARPTRSYEIFQSRDAIVQSIISSCTSGVSDENSTLRCHATLGCILDRVSSDTAARWSAGASILAFIPTIVGLMSNSVSEVTAIAENETVLAMLLCLSSTTAFSSRFQDRYSVNGQGTRGNPFRKRAALDEVVEFVRSNRLKDTQWWQKTQVQNVATGFTLLGLSAGLWFEIYEISRYGIIVFACPVKVNIIMWAGLTQILGLFNIALRRQLFNIRKIHIPCLLTAQPRQNDSKAASKRSQSKGHVDASTKSDIIAAAKDNHTKCLTIILRSPKSTKTRWLLQILTAIFSYCLYTFGTAVLASVIMVPASDAIRATVVICVCAGVSRIIGYWTGSMSRVGRMTMLVDVPTAHVERMVEAIEGL